MTFSRQPAPEVNAFRRPSLRRRLELEEAVAHGQAFLLLGGLCALLHSSLGQGRAAPKLIATDLRLRRPQGTETRTKRMVV